MHTLTLFFDWLLTASLRASVLTLGVWLVQGMLQRHLSPRWRYALWLPVLVVLLMPVLPESRWSAASVFTLDAPAMDMPPVSVVENAAPVSMPVPSVLPVEHARPIDWSRVRVVTWAVGVLLMLLTGMVSFTRTLTRARRTREAISDELATRIDEVTQEVGLKQKPRLLMSPRIQSPAVTGLLRPLLLLPPGFDRDFTAEEKRLILHHELMHLKRGDLPLNTLLCVLMALHWFNPLLWLAFLKVRADREAACDAQVLENATSQRRSAYGHALLKIESAFAPLRLSLGFIGILQRHASLRARIRSIAAPARTRPFTGLVVTVCMLALTFLGITRAATEDKDEPEIYLTARFIELNGAKNDAGSADKILAEVLDDLPTSQKDTTPLRIVFDDPQAQLFMRRLSSRKGVDLMSTPSVTTRSGLKASIEVAREFVPPGKKPLEKKVGVMLDLLPTLKKADEIELTLNPRIVEFEGFKKNAQGEDEPAFNERQANAILALKPGQTVLLDLGSRSDTQIVEDVHIITGKTTRQTNHFTRRAIVLVTVKVQKPKKAEKASVDEKKAVPATITADKVTFDEQQNIGRYAGHARLEMSVADEERLIATSDEIIYRKQDDLVIVKAPLEVRKGKLRITGEEKGAEARIDLKNGQWQLSGGKFKTALTSEALPKQADSPAAASAALLRTAPAVRYHFKKERLGDILQRLAKEAGISLLSLPDASPDAGKLITFATELSPFSTIEVLCKANGLGIYRYEDQWLIQRLDHREFFSKLYAIPELDAPRISMLIEDIDAIIDAKSFQGDQKPQAVYKKDQKGIYVTGTRLHHVWVNGYLEAAGKTKLMK